MAQTVGFSRALATVRRTVAAQRDAKRRARAVRIPPCNPSKVFCKNKKAAPRRVLPLAQTVGFEPTWHCCQIDFESISLRPLRYVCLFGFTACYMGNMVCALLHLTHSHIAHYSIPNLSPFVNQNSRCFCVGVGSKGESSWWRRMKTWRVFSVMDRPLCLGTV